MSTIRVRPLLENVTNDHDSECKVCPICWEIPCKDILVLPCNHTFCLPCIDEVIFKRKFGLNGRIFNMSKDTLCPVCRQNIFGPSLSLPRMLKRLISETNYLNKCIRTNVDRERIAISLLNEWKEMKWHFKFLQTGPNKVNTLDSIAEMEIGKVLLCIKNWESARDSFEKSIKLDPELHDMEIDDYDYDSSYWFGVLLENAHYGLMRCNSETPPWKLVPSYIVFFYSCVNLISKAWKLVKSMCKLFLNRFKRKVHPT
jgi:hypothetical protein